MKITHVHVHVHVHVPMPVQSVHQWVSHAGISEVNDYTMYMYGLQLKIHNLLVHNLHFKISNLHFKISKTYMYVHKYLAV